MKTISLTTPFSDDDVRALRVGDEVLVSGEVYALRDAGHRRLVELIRAGEPAPFEMKGAVIYYVGPTPAPEGMVIGSAGPTTAARMDAYMPEILAAGAKATIGKGRRSAGVIELMKKHCAVYLAAIGGTGALLSGHITAVETVAWEDLGTEALRRLVVRGFPAICANDVQGNDIFTKGRNA